MEKYKEIRDYLKIFPEDMVVGQLVDNIDKAESEFEEKRKVKIKEIKDKYVGNTYYFEEVDDGSVVCKYILYVKAVSRDLKADCKAIIITGDSIHYVDKEHVDIDSLSVARKFSKDIFFIAKEKFDALTSFAV